MCVWVWVCGCVWVVGVGVGGASLIQRESCWQLTTISCNCIHPPTLTPTSDTHTLTHTHTPHPTPTHCSMYLCVEQAAVDVLPTTRHPAAKQGCEDGPVCLQARQHIHKGHSRLGQSTCEAVNTCGSG